MCRWLNAPRGENAYQTFSMRVLHYTLLLLLLLTISFIPFANANTRERFLLMGIILFGVCYGLLHTGRFRAASTLFLVGLWCVITLAAFNTNGVRNSAVSLYAVIIIFSAVLFSGRAVLVFTGLCIVAMGLLALGEVQGLLPLSTTELRIGDRLFQQVVLFGSAGILLWATARVIRAGLIQLSQHEQSLIEHNAALQAEIERREQVEETLRASEEKYRLLFEHSGTIVGVYNRDGILEMINPAGAAIFGRSVEELRGVSMEELFQPDDAARGRKRHEQVMTTGVPMLYEGQITLRNGRSLYYLRHIRPLPYPDDPPGETRRVLIITTDITQQKQAEQHARALVLAQQKNTFLTDFLSTVSHDLKTPLTVMSTGLYLLERAQTPAEQQERIDQMKEQVTLLDKYIQDMLTISRLEHLPAINAADVDVNHLAQDVLALLRPRAEKKQIECHLITGFMPGMARGDREQLQRVLVNLVENAINYTPAGGWVRVQTLADDERVRVEVSDSGIGIDADDLPHIFDRFYRSEEARNTEESGTGLGLAIVKKIVEMHAGAIDVRSTPGQGSVFGVWLPRQRTPDAAAISQS